MSARPVARLALLCAVLLGWPVILAAQQPAAPAPSMVDAYRLVYAGRNTSAAALARSALAAAPSSQWESLFRAAARLCVVIMDAPCAHAILAQSAPVLAAMPRTALEPGTDAHRVLLDGFLRLATTAEPVQFFGPDLPDEVVNPRSMPVLLADLHLLAALQARRRADFQEARDHLDKALIATLSVATARTEAVRLTVRIIAGLIDVFEVERAIRLFAAATPLFDFIPPHSFLAYEYVLVVNRLASQRKAFDVVSTGLRKALELLQGMELRPAVRRELLAATCNELVGVELMRGDHDAVRRLLASHPLAQEREAILARGAFVSDGEFFFAVAEVLAGASLGTAIAGDWFGLLAQTPGWTQDAERREEMAAFREAAMALRLMQAGDTEQARALVVRAGRNRLASLQRAKAKSVYASPIADWTDRLLLESAVTGAFSRPAPDYGFIVAAQRALARSVETRPDDALTLAAAQGSDERRRWAQGFTAVRRQQMDWERGETVALVRDLAANANLQTAASRSRRAQVFSVGNAFVERKQRLRQALQPQAGGPGEPADLERVQRLLHRDEALLVHVPLGNAVGKLCIRRDSVLSSSQPVEPAAALADARRLRSALTAERAASPQADSQYPVPEAIRLAQLLFDGLAPCLAASPRLYMVATADVLGEVPPSALLLEPPPAWNGGYDLGAAHWLARDHSFVRVSSIDAFVAMRGHATVRTAGLDYLGVADPAPATALPASAGTQPGERLRSALAALPPLPETAQEVQRVAASFPPHRVRVLAGKTATEQAFRLEPLSEFDILHFATHGLIREELPGLTQPALVFSPGSGADVRDDGLLDASEIAALPLRARLVVLSACNSARYQPSIIDDGIQGLSIAFAAAGVPSTLAALWPVESTIARDLVTTAIRLAREQGLTIADALAAAMRKHLAGPTPRPFLHPRFWASFVLLGEGALTLDVATPAAPRALAPFMPAGSDGGHVLAATAAGADFVTSEIGASQGRPPPSLLRRRTADGAVRWTVNDPAIGAGPVVSAGRTIYAGGYRWPADAPGAQPAAILRALSTNGEVLWSRELASDAQATQVMGLAARRDGSALALVALPPGDAKGARLRFIEVDADGAVGRALTLEPLTLEVAADSRSGQSAYLAVERDRGLVVVSRSPRPVPRADGYDWRGVKRACLGDDDADIRVLDLSSLRETRRLAIERFAASAALPLDGDWLLAGAERVECGGQYHAALYRLARDGSIRLTWRDSSPSDSVARAVRPLAGELEVIGYATRSIAVPHEVRPHEVRPAQAPALDATRVGAESSDTGELFAVRVSQTGIERTREFIAAGLPIVPSGMSIANGRNAIFGSVGGRPLWLPR